MVSLKYRTRTLFESTSCVDVYEQKQAANLGNFYQYL